MADEPGCPFESDNLPAEDYPCPVCGADASEFCRATKPNKSALKALSERDALAAENARLREALGMVLAIHGEDFAGTLDPAYHAETGDRQPDSTDDADWDKWSERYIEWEKGKLTAARALVESPR